MFLAIVGLVYGLMNVQDAVELIKILLSAGMGALAQEQYLFIITFNVLFALVFTRCGANKNL